MTDATQRKRMLAFVVEDNEDHIIILRQLLNSIDFDVVTETTPEKVTNAVRMLQPNIVLMDVMLASETGIGGFELCTDLKHDSQTAHIPVIILSAIAAGLGEKTEKIKRETGADDVVTKPYNPTVLLDRIRQLAK